jgi:hypothetical protein
MWGSFLEISQEQLNHVGTRKSRDVMSPRCFPEVAVQAAKIVEIGYPPAKAIPWL